MAILEILKYGDERLRMKSEPVVKVDEELKKLISDMADTLKLSSGIGLAAPQIGVNKRLFIYDLGEESDGLHALINPKIIKKIGTDNWFEGCLSVPGIQAKVERALKVIITGLDENGSPVRIKASDYLARCFQHETDHLDGVIFMDIADPTTIEPVEPDDDEKKEYI